MAKRLNNAQKGKIVKLRGQGIDQRAVAAGVGCSQKTVSRLENNDPEVKAAIKLIQHNIITKGAPLAEEIVLSALTVGRRLWRKAKKAKQPGTVISDNKEALDLAHKNLKAVLQPMGFSAAPGQPFFLQQIYNDHRTQVDSEELESVKGYLEYKAEQDIQEAQEAELLKDEPVEAKDLGHGEGKKL
jgi:transcriptional regulator with XRE-family HTH domain